MGVGKIRKIPNKSSLSEKLIPYIPHYESIYRGKLGFLQAVKNVLYD